MFKYTSLFILILLSNFSFAQEDSAIDENPFSISCDLVSRYVWRGSQLSDSPSIQPGLEYNKKGLTIGAWGSYAVSITGAQEVDLYISYTYKNRYSIIVTDYYFPDATIDYQYFDWNKESTGHILEISLAYNGTENFPLKLLLASNHYGADVRRINDDNTIGDIMFSTYAEASYSFKRFETFIGVNLTDVDTEKGELGFYGNSIGVVNFGISTSKDLEITDKFRIPLTLSLITNPQAQKIYFVAGFSF